MADPNPNKIRAVHDKFWALVLATFPEDAAQSHRNPSGHKQPAPKVDGLVGYLAMQDDNQPEVLGVLTGPIYDLQATPRLTLAFSGKTKDVRSDAAWAKVEALKAAVKADPTLGDTVDYCEVALPEDLPVSDSDWMAGGLEVGIELLFTAPSRAG